MKCATTEQAPRTICALTYEKWSPLSARCEWSPFTHLARIAIFMNGVIILLLQSSTFLWPHQVIPKALSAFLLQGHSVQSDILLG